MEEPGLSIVSWLRIVIIKIIKLITLLDGGFIIYTNGRESVRNIEADSEGSVCF